MQRLSSTKVSWLARFTALCLLGGLDVVTGAIFAQVKTTASVSTSQTFLGNVSTVPRRPFPQHTIYAAGTIAPDHVTQSQMDADARGDFDAWKLNYLEQAGTELDGHPRYRVRLGRNTTDATVSEGQGYGMLLAVIFAGHDPEARSVFDGLWEFSLDHRSVIDPRLMDWYVNADESPDSNGDDCAFDGDCDIAYALLLAEAQWGNRGRFDYGAAARSVADGLIDSAVGAQSSLPMLGDWVPSNGSPYSQWTPRSSDFILGHFRAFEDVAGDGRWGQVLLACQDVIDQVQIDYSSTSGLLPDFLVPVASSGLPLMPAPGGFLEGPADGAYSYNACRDPWRLGSDALISGDSRSLLQAQSIAEWIRVASGGNPFSISAGYRLDGTPLPGSNFFTTVFAAPFAAAAMTDPNSQVFLNGLYDATVHSDEGYYEDSVALLSLVVMGRNWWRP